MGTYTEILKQSNPDINKLGWHIDWYRNQNIVNHVLGSVMENNFVVSGGNLSGPSGLEIDIDATIVEIAGVQYSIAADTLSLTGASVNPEETNWIYVNSSGVLTVATTPPTEREYCPIGLVDADATTVVRVADFRITDPSGYETPVESDFQNSELEIWQGYSAPVVISADALEYVADRIGHFRTTGSALTITRGNFTVGQTVVPGNPNHFLQAVFVTNSSSTEENYDVFRIKDVKKYSGKTVAFQFYASMDSSKDVALEVSQNFGSGGSASVQVGVETISLTTTDEKQIVFITFPSITGKTVGTLSYNEFKVWHSAGSSFNANTNSLGNQSGTLKISEIRPYQSEKERPVRRRTPEEALDICLPYYEEGSSFWSGLCQASTNNIQSFQFKVDKVHAAGMLTTDFTSMFNITAVTVLSNDTKKFNPYPSAVTTPNTLGRYQVIWSYRSEL